MSYVACWCYLLYMYRRVGSVLRNGAAGTGPIWLDDVQCIGTETHIDQCRHNDWGSNNCGHVEDVYISCADTEMGKTFAFWRNSLLNIEDMLFFF